MSVLSTPTRLPREHNLEKLTLIPARLLLGLPRGASGRWHLEQLTEAGQGAGEGLWGMGCAAVTPVEILL